MFPFVLQKIIFIILYSNPLINGIIFIIRQIRRQLPLSELRKGARKPWRRVGGRHLNIGTNNGSSHTNGSSGNSTNSVRGIDMSQMV